MTSQKTLNVTIDLPQDLQDMGYKELIIKRENGIVKTVDNTAFLFPFNLDRYKKSIDALKEALEARKVDERVITIVCSKITDVIVNYDFDGNGGSISSNSSIATNSITTETKIILDEISVLIEKYKDLPYEVWQQERTKRYEALKQAINDNIPESWESIECVLTSKGIMHVKDITLPLIFIIIGNPSTWKTIAIGMLRRWFGTYYVDKINPKSFVSHANVENREELEYIDLIRDMKDRLFLIPELAPIFMQKEDVLVEILSTLVRLADGEGLLTHSGLHGLRGVDDRLMFSMVGATVEIPTRVYKALSSLGPKLYFYRTNFKQPLEQQLQDDITGKSFEVKIRNIKNALFDYLKWLEVCPLMVNIVSVANTDGGLDQTKIDSSTRRVIEWDKSKDDINAIKMISRIAILLARIRGNAYAYESRSTGARLTNIEDDDEESENNNNNMSYEYNFEQPIIENPSRANQVLYNIARAHAFEIHGRNYITIEDIPIAIKIALCTANRNRVSVLRLMITEMRRADIGGHLEHKKRFLTKDLMNSLKISKSTARRVMKELDVLEVVKVGKEKMSNGKYHDYVELVEKFHWLLDNEFQNLLKDFGWDIWTGSEDDEAPLPMRRIYPGSDKWECDYCKLSGDFYSIRNHVLNCKEQLEDKEVDKGQTKL